MEDRMTRRTFIAVGAGAAGGLLVAVALPGWGRGGADPPPERRRFGAFLEIDTAGEVTVTIPVPEMGQGVRTSLAMLVAEELEADWARVRVRQADAADDLGPHPFAGGSQAVRASWLALR
ncbi:MAG TPA: molybdopterin cofactor-binding domain-containing protein, partial [Longimicrobium sp.]|nr:molybdopterin cofactor-binding domain-containing protein [Longimicrobium sp.]